MNHRRNLMYTAALLLLAAAGALVFALSPNFSGTAAAGNNTVLTVDGSPVTKDEFSIFLQNNKAMTASYFQSKYHAEYSSEFWTTAFNGEIPIDYAKQKTVGELKKVKVEQLLMKDNGEMNDIGFDRFMQNLEQENQERRAKIDKKEPVYGLTQFSPYQYYNYLQSTHYINLINSLVSSRKYQLSEAVYRDYYEKQKEKYYNKGFIYEGELIQNNATVETLTLDLQSISKEDELKRSLYNEAGRLKPNELSEPFPYNNGQARFKLTNKQALGYKSFDEVKSDVKKLYIHEDLQNQIADRLNRAKVKLNPPVYDAIRMN